MEQQVIVFDKAVDFLLQKLRSMPGPLLLAIAGGSCSGKTYLYTQLQQRLVEFGANLFSYVPLDFYFKDIDDPEVPRDEHGRKHFDQPASYHGQDFQVAVEQLLSGKNIHLPDYELTTNSRKSADGELVQASPIVIAEGLFALEFLKQIQTNVLKVFVECDQEIRMQRRVERDTALYDVAARRVRDFFLERIVPGHQMFVQPQKEIADIVVQN